MRHTYVSTASFLLLFVASITCIQAQDPPPLSVEQNPTDATGFAIVKYKMSKGDDIQWVVSPKPTLKKSYVEGDYSYLIFNGPPNQVYTVTADWINWDAKKRGQPTLDVVIGKAPQPPPSPTPTPIDPDVKPIPISKSLRVIFVYETSQSVTIPMQQAMFGEKVRTYLDAKTVRGISASGWRRFDPDVNIFNERDGNIKAIWIAAKPKITKVPCVIIATEANKIDIVDFPSGEDEALALFKKYGG